MSPHPVNGVRSRASDLQPQSVTTCRRREIRVGGLDEGDDTLPELLSAAGELLLPSDVLGASRRGLHRHGLIAPGTQIIGTRLHVRRPDVAGQSERVEPQIPGEQGAELRGPLVEVHRGVEAARLLHLPLVLPGGGAVIAGNGLRGEETESIEVGAADPVGFHHPVGPGGTETQRLGMAGPVPVDHRPFVHAEAGEPRWAGRRAPQQRVDEGHRTATGGEEGPGVEGPGLALLRGDHVMELRGTGETAAVGVLGEEKSDTGAGGPAAQLAGFHRVVGEHEVPHRMPLTG